MDIEKEVQDILETKRDGGTILELAGMLNIHRHTLTKYIYKLEGEGKITVRKVGSAKLCYIKQEGENR
jgi:predicted transcriptional regulator